MSTLRTLLLLISCGNIHCNSDKPLIAGEAVERWPLGFDGWKIVERLARTSSDGRWWVMAPSGLLSNQVKTIQKAELPGI